VIAGEVTSSESVLIGVTEKNVFIGVCTRIIKKAPGLLPEKVKVNAVPLAIAGPLVFAPRRSTLFFFVPNFAMDTYGFFRIVVVGRGAIAVGVAVGVGVGVDVAVGVGVAVGLGVGVGLGVTVRVGIDTSTR
jgi:hypothetical protein